MGFSSWLFHSFVPSRDRVHRPHHPHQRNQLLHLLLLQKNILLLLDLLLKLCVFFLRCVTRPPLPAPRVGEDGKVHFLCLLRCAGGCDISPQEKSQGVHLISVFPMPAHKLCSVYHFINNSKNEAGLLIVFTLTQALYVLICQ